MARNQCSWLKVFWGFVFGRKYKHGWTSKLMVYCQDLLFLLSEYVEECLGGMSHFINLSSLLVLGFCYLLMWGVFLKEAFWIVSIMLIWCMLLAPELHPVVFVVLITKDGVLITTLGSTIEVPMELMRVKSKWSDPWRHVGQLQLKNI